MSMRRAKLDAPKAPAPEPAAEWVSLAALKPWAKNPRRNDANTRRVADSIKRFGFAAPILARRADGEIIAGHTRYAAAKVLGLDVVPVRYLDLDPADAHLLALADNRLGELGEWDDARLLELLGDLRQHGDDAALVAGWSAAEIDGLLRGGGDAILAGDLDADDAFGALPTGDEPGVQTMSFRLTAAERAPVGAALSKAGDASSGAALAAVCRAYLDG